MTDQELIELIIPIYTLRRPHPVKKRQDCPMEKDYKRGQRELMRKELATATKEQKKEIIARYRAKINAL